LKVLDSVIFYITGFSFGAAGLFFILVKNLFKRTNNLIKKSAPLNRLTFCVMDMEKAKNQNGLIEEILLKGSISRQISVSFDFESEEDRIIKITDNITCYHFSIHGKNNFARFGFKKTGEAARLIRNIFFLLGVCRREKINCVESHEAVFLGFIGLLFSRFLKAPFILHFNTSYEVKYKARHKISVRFLRFRILEKWLEYLSARLADVIMADRAFYKNMGAFPKRCAGKYISTGVRVAKAHYTGLDTRRNLKKDLRAEDRDMILYVGRLHPVKYVTDLVDAFKKVYERNKKSILVIAGEGVLEKKLRDMARDYGLGKNVIFLGPKTQEELKDIFFTADVVVQPHGGVVLLEAALAGTPCVVYDFDWHKEFLQNDKMGFVVPFRDTERLAEKTLNLLMDKNLNARMGLYSRAVAASGYSREKSIGNEKAIYDALLRGRI